MTRKYTTLSALYLLLCSAVATAQQPLAQAGNNGKLLYNTYANEGESNAVNRIPDFSFAGYKGGGVRLPVVAVKQTLQPSPGDNREKIQAAIDAVSALTPNAAGQRGAILLRKGSYEVSGPLYIRKDGVVLRGEGQALNGTVLKATQQAQHTLIIITGEGKGYQFDKNAVVNITAPYIPVGAVQIEVANAAAFSVGDDIVVERTPNQTWIDDLQMAQYGWKAADYHVRFERRITAIKGNTLTINVPMVDVLQARYGSGQVYKATAVGRIQQCGVEQIRLESTYSSDTAEDHAWKGVMLQRATNCWVKQVTARYFGYACVSIEGESVYNTVEECAMTAPVSITTGGRKYSFNIGQGAAFNLFTRCYTQGGRHDFVTSSRVPGPNVFLDCYATDTHADIGPHHRWATGLLFDNVYGGQIRVRNRKASGTGHGWSGAQTLFWNCCSYKEDLMVDSPKGARNWGIGNSAKKFNGDGYWENKDKTVTPRSLYIQQLQDRLGTAAVNNVIPPTQRRDNIWKQLEQWKGESTLKL
ncbi:hypothetical protein CK934_09175 [Chitinophaga sp. MD30]|nr:hypothetical protein CK934_09175 [Chitinophaga sp. MD30]